MMAGIEYEDDMSDASKPQPSGPRKKWNFTPELPIRLAPYWDWPVKPVQSFFYLLRSWKPVGLQFVFLAAAFIVWNVFPPDLEAASTLSFGWISQIFLRNFIILTVGAGGLHLYLWYFKGQGDEFRYDMRPMPQNARAFFFGNQVLDNMLWSYVALIFWTFWECLIWYSVAHGWITLISFDSNPIWFCVLIILLPMWSGWHFYMHHRLLHTPFLYKHVHSWHHKNVNTGPWSGLAMHPVESFILFTDCLIFFLVPAHPFHILYIFLFHGIGAPASHAGFEKVKVGETEGFEMGDFFHQLHHRFCDCNYGTYETPWDKWFGTFHDGAETGDEMMKERRKVLAQANKS